MSGQRAEQTLAFLSAETPFLLSRNDERWGGATTGCEDTPARRENAGPSPTGLVGACDLCSGSQCW